MTMLCDGGINSVWIDPQMVMLVENTRG